ncbi:MAG: hypothetical protein IJ867_01915 [Clostridia bacterium]|nr:hypothetical protein [Clostridia bacterium]
MDQRFLYYLYTQPTVPDMIASYSRELLRSPNPLDQLKAKRLLQYWALLTDKVFFEERMKNFFTAFYKEAGNQFSNVTFEIFGRVKGLISSMNKMEEIEETTINKLKSEFINQSKEANPSEKDLEKFLLDYNFKQNPFDKIRDFFAFRIILEDEGHGDMLEEMYDFANFTMQFFEQNQFELLPATPLRQTGKLNVQSDLIFIPKKSLILPEYKKKVKDYAASPKSDGYQSVQFVITDLFTQRKFECQIRTRSMDIIARTLADHNAHKANRYGKQQKEVAELVDYSKVKVKGFRYFEYVENGEEKVFISDHAGITEPIPVTMADHHFNPVF